VAVAAVEAYWLFEHTVKGAHRRSLVAVSIWTMNVVDVQDVVTGTQTRSEYAVASSVMY
jgi:hypothetical protein